MKLSQLWKSEKSDDEPAQPLPTLLEELPPRFEDDVAAKESISEALRPSLGREISKIGPDDFRNLSAMPCFRDAMLIGLGMGGVSGGVIFFLRRTPWKAANWMVGGFFVGSVVSWEQCRTQVRQGKANMRAAQIAYRKAKLAEKAAEEATLELARKNSRPWWKLW